MAELVTIPISRFEYMAEFGRPIFALSMDKAGIVQSVFDSLAPWKPDIGDVELLEIGKASERGVNFKLPQKRITFFFGAGSCRFTKDDADWASSDETMEILEAARNSVLATSGAVICKQSTGIALHLQPRNKSFIEILAPFISGKIRELHAEDPIRTAAAIVRWEKKKLILDGSGSLANGVFVRFDREFGCDTTIEEMAKELRGDEEAIFNMIDVEEDRA